MHFSDLIRHSKVQRFSHAFTRIKYMRGIRIKTYKLRVISSSIQLMADASDLADLTPHFKSTIKKVHLKYFNIRRIPKELK